MRKAATTAARLLLFILLFCLCAVSVSASTGRVVGVIRDAEGNPLPDLLVSLVARGVQEALPILTRTDAAGRLVFHEIEAGRYEVAVTSSLFLSPAGRVIEVQPGETVSIKLVLEHLLALGGDAENVGIKSLLRSATHRRLIFRNTPIPGEDAGRFFDRAALQVVTDTGLGSDSFGFPGNEMSGTTTSFAMQDSLLGGGDYIVAGQIHSGADSFWRIRNILDYDLASNQSLRLYLGYGRVSFGQVDYSGNNLLEVDEFDQPASSTRILSAGLEDRWQFGDSLSLLLGFELNQVRGHTSRSFISPNAQLDFEPREGTDLQLRMSSRRRTRGSSVQLPGGELVSLSDAVFLSPGREGLTFGTTRQVEARIVQSVGADTRVEVAAFRSRVLGAPVPIVATWQNGGGSEILPLADDHADSRGYRFAVSRQITPNIRATVSYTRAAAPGLRAGDAKFTGTPATALDGLVDERTFHAISTEIDAFIPVSQTQITALLNTAPGGSPLVNLNALTDLGDASNHGFNLFVRQLLPVPETLLGFMGLDFLSAYRLEVLLDVRNLTNEELGLLQGALGNLVIAQRPRSVRGGIAVKF